MTADAARTFGELKAKLRRRSVQVAPMDLLIAAIALRHGCTLATGNVRHFRSVPDLRVENWIRRFRSTTLHAERARQVGFVRARLRRTAGQVGRATPRTVC